MKLRDFSLFQRKQSVQQVGSKSSTFVGGIRINAQTNFKNYTQKLDQLKAYLTIPEISNVVGYEANAFIRGDLKLYDYKDNEITDHKVLELLENPNVIQGEKEFLKDLYINWKIFGNSYMYANLPTGFNFNIENISNLWAMPSLYTEPIGTGRYFNQREAKDIIQYYLFKYQNSYKAQMATDHVLHKSNETVFPNLEGTSIITRNANAISNLSVIYEADNVVIGNHGSLGLFTNDQSDSAGIIPFDDKEHKRTQEYLDKFGLSNDKDQYMITNLKLKYINTIANIKDLQLDEKHLKYRNILLDAFGFPRDLMSTEKGSTFTNKKEAIKDLYENTIIPDADNWCGELNRFFKLKEQKLYLKFDYSKVKALQTDQKLESESFQKNEISCRNMFLKGVITRNQWLVKCGFKEVNNPEFDKYIQELKPEVINLIMNNAK